MQDPYRLSMTVQAANGQTWKWGPDSPDGRDVPQDIETTTSLPGGHGTCTSSLFRDIRIDYPDNNVLDTVRLYGPGSREATDGRKSVFEGFMSSFPRQHGAQFSIDPGAVGFSAALGFFPGFQRVYVDRSSGSWGDPPFNRKAGLAGLAIDFGSFSWSSDGGGLVCALPNQALGAQAIAETWYQSPAGCKIGAVEYIGADTSLPASWEAPKLAIYADDAAAVGEFYSLTFDSTLRTATPTTARQYAVLREYSNATASTPAAGANRRVSAVAVYGDHGLTKRAIDATTPDGLYNCDIVADILAQTVPGVLNWTTGTGGSIEPNNTIVPHLVFSGPGTAQDALAKASGFGITPFLLPEWGVYDNRTFFWRSPDSSRLCWKARYDSGIKPRFDGETADDVINGVLVTFSDPAGISRVVGPPAQYWPTGVALADSTDTSLVDTDPTNPINEHADSTGGVKWATLNLSQPCTTAGAIALGSMFLAIQSQPQRRGQIEISGLVGHPTITQGQPVYKMRAGDWLQLTDSESPELRRRIIGTRYSHPTRSITCDLDNRPFTLDALLEVLQADLVSLG
jgi:hypothetical protein